MTDAPGRRGRPIKQGPVSPMGEYYRRLKTTDPGKAAKIAGQERARYVEYRKRALAMVAGGPIECAWCRCDDQRVLEIDHKEGGGSKEVGKGQHRLYIDIAKGRRETGDLRILCRVCNWLHEVQVRHPDLTGSWRVTWLGSGR